MNRPETRYVTHILAPQEAARLQRSKWEREARRPHRTDTVPREPRRSNIIAGLLELRRQGRLNGVWIDADVIRVREAGDMQGPPSRLTWLRAGALVE